MERPVEGGDRGMESLDERGGWNPQGAQIGPSALQCSTQPVADPVRTVSVHCFLEGLKACVAGGGSPGCVSGTRLGRKTFFSEL